MVRTGPGARALMVAMLACGAGAADVLSQAAPAGAQGAAYDAAATDTARVLAGLAPVDASRLDAVTKRPVWRAYRDDIDQHWSRLKTERLAAMRAWSEREIAPASGPCDTLFYPFGGPDFINAYVLFPGCSRYLLFGLEAVGSEPALERLDAQALEALLAELRASLSDVFVRDYFITREMMTELKTPGLNGTLPLLLVFLARLDARIVDIRMDSPWSEGGASNGTSARPAGSGAPPGLPQRPSAVTIRFSLNGSARVQALSYARVRMEDAEFAKQAALQAYLDRQAPFTTMLKSASYLLHDNQFSRVRAAVLSGSRAVLQDDTGVPFRFFDSAWSIRLFGRYSPPVKDFNYGRQPDLERAYRDTAAVRDLPFPYGYHWRQGSSSVMLAVRKAPVR